MVQSEVENSGGEVIDLSAKENAFWKHKRQGRGTVSTYFIIEDLVTDAVVVRDEHEPEWTADLPFSTFEEDVANGDIVQVSRASIPKDVLEATERDL